MTWSTSHMYQITAVTKLLSPMREPSNSKKEIWNTTKDFYEWQCFFCWSTWIPSRRYDVRKLNFDLPSLSHRQTQELVFSRGQGLFVRFLFSSSDARRLPIPKNLIRQQQPRQKLNYEKRPSHRNRTDNYHLITSFNRDRALSTRVIRMMSRTLAGNLYVTDCSQLTRRTARHIWLCG